MRTALAWSVVCSLAGALGACGVDAKSGEPGPAPKADSSDDAGPLGDAGPYGSAPDSGPPGHAPCPRGVLLREASFDFEGEPRRFLLYVPEDLPCTEEGVPLLVDLHGASGGVAAKPEEQYSLAEAMAAADEAGIVLLRPRSRFQQERTGATWYRWDQSPGDLEANQRFIAALTSDLASQYPIDRQRVFVLGFSSGANMAAYLLEHTTGSFRGYGMVGGARWQPVTLGDITTQPAVYFSTGSRDYGFGHAFRMRDALVEAGWAPEKLYWDSHPGGHYLGHRHYARALPFLLEGRRASLRSSDPWVRDDSVPTSTELGAVVVGSNGEPTVGAADGGVWTRQPEGGWSRRGGAALASPVTAFCEAGDAVFGAAGSELFSVGDEGLEVASLSRGSSPYPPYVYDVACHSHRIAWGGGVLGVAPLAEGLRPDVEWLFGGQVEAQTIAYERSGILLVAGGYGFLARQLPGTSPAPVELPHDLPPDWWAFGSASSRHGAFFLVGRGGAIARSQDAGLRWEVVRGFDPRARDLFGVAFANANEGVAVGDGGAVLITLDGGESWTSRDADASAVLADIAFSDSKVFLVGTAGTLLEASADDVFDPE